MAQNENEAVNRLRRTPLSWAELKAIILSSNLNNLSKLARSEDQTTTYRNRRADIKNEWESIYDYLLCTKFGFEWVESVDSSSGDEQNNNLPQRKKRSKPTFQEYLDDLKQREKEGKCNKQLKLCLNDFPYYLAPEIEHWILWKLGGDVTADEITNAKSEILKGSQLWVAMDNGQKPGSTENSNNLEQLTVNDPEVLLHWINPPHLKSLPGIDHVHIIFHSGRE